MILYRSFLLTGLGTVFHFQHIVPRKCIFASKSLVFCPRNPSLSFQSYRELSSVLKEMFSGHAQRHHPLLLHFPTLSCSIIVSWTELLKAFAWIKPHCKRWERFLGGWTQAWNTEGTWKTQTDHYNSTASLLPGQDCRGASCRNKYLYKQTSGSSFF